MVTRGFTVVELIITITIMGILLLLTVVNINSSQIQARDSERVGDIEAIQGALESFYEIGTTGSTNINRYATTNLTSSVAIMTSTLRDINTKSLMAPGISDPAQTFISATNNTQTTAGVLPQPTISQYVYQPIMPDGALCISGNIDCRKYNLYYRLEKDNTVYMVTSKNQ